MRLPIFEVSSPEIKRDPFLIEKVTDNRQKIIIATNVLETGITVHNLSFVIDTMKFKSVYYDPVRKCEVLRDLPISKDM